MAWVGKILGFFIGLSLAGPIGAILGLLAGHYLDGGFINPFFVGLQSNRYQIQQTFFKALFSIMGYVAKIDGRVSETEIKLAEQLMQQMRLTPYQKRDAIGYFKHGKEKTFNFDETLNQLWLSCRSNPNLLRLFIETQFQLAYANGQLSNKKRQILKYLCERLGFSTMDFLAFDNRFRASFSYQQQGHSQQRQKSYTNQPQWEDPIKKAYQTLGISPNATDAEVKKAYRRLMSRHHPDKSIAKGLSEPLLKLATEKTQQIKAAYETIRKARRH